MIARRGFVTLSVTCFALAACSQAAGPSGSQYMPAFDAFAKRSAGSVSYKVLHYFGKGSDGYAPQSSLIVVKGALYGTTYGGGSSNFGTVYRISKTGAETVLHSFAGGSDGAEPESGLINVKDTLYGTTAGGGSANLGTVYGVSLTGRERVLHSFGGGSDGAQPESGLIDVNGTLYGTTLNGGNATSPECFPGGCGTVYTISTKGVEKLLHSFAGGSDGAFPRAGLIDVKGTLYGTTSGGGGTGCSLPPEARQPRNSFVLGCGTVYTISRNGVERVLHSFAGGADGVIPESGLVDVKNILYGTTGAGGVGCPLLGCGTVYTVGRKGAAKLLYGFAGGSDGAEPESGLIDAKGRLYGATAYGGGSGCNRTGCGTVYAISTKGTEKVLYSFKGGKKDGAVPVAGLVESNGTLYGTAEVDGKYAESSSSDVGGIVFALTP